MITPTASRAACLAIVLSCFSPSGQTGEQRSGSRDRTQDPEIDYLQRTPQRPAFVAERREPCTNHDLLNNAYFGDLHVHTSLSMDAYLFEDRSRPDDAYAFARGQTLYLPPYDDSGKGTRPFRIDRPLDFLAVTDHAEFLGEVALCRDESSTAYQSEPCIAFRNADPDATVDALMERILAVAGSSKGRSGTLCGDDGAECLEAAVTPWLETQQAAERWYDRSGECRFSTFVGYEYSLSEASSNLHRNVIFANSAVPRAPLSATEAPVPEMLWRWLTDVCIESETGCDALAIPHNSNWSSGRMFFPEYAPGGGAEARDAAELRARLEPLVEIMQIKGDSECRQGLYGVSGTVDEHCAFEKLRRPNEAEADCRDGVGSDGKLLEGCVSRWSYTRYGLVQGLAEKVKLGVNPFEYGFVGSTDTHLGTGGAVRERDFPGSIGTNTTAPERLSSVVTLPGIAKLDSVRHNPGGLVGVWAPENSRAALFWAMKKRETFGTSGPRIVPRFFGGWQYPDELCSDPEMVSKAYDQGVPMGSHLPPRPDGEKSPGFVVAAMQDAWKHGTPLQRIQVIKGWMDDDGVMQQRVHEVAGSPDNEATVDTGTCELQGEGHASLCAVWRDPDFDADKPAVYYARVLENPSCRWSTWQCNELPESERPESCRDPLVPKTIQERAWTSPLWYYPE